MQERCEQPADFEATITVFTEEEGGRKKSAFNGIRWDFMYAGDAEKMQTYMIWPEFVDADGNLIPSDIPLRGTLHAVMRIVDQNMRNTVHAGRLKANHVTASSRHDPTQLEASQ